MTDAMLADLLAPPARSPDERFAAQTARLIAVERRLAAQARAGRQRAVAGSVAAFAAAGGLALFATGPAVAGLGGGLFAAPAALAVLLLVLAAQSPALRAG